jgi:predicted outer membrane protein/sporulation protein YlmC with PRC-barrel domain
MFKSVEYEMRPNLPMLFGTTALVAALVAPGAMQAQNRSESQSQAGQQQQSDQQQQQRPESQTAQKMSDRDFIEQAESVNMFEIRAGEMALDRSQDQEIRDFARQIVDDHRRLQDRLTNLAGKANVPSQLDQRHSNLVNRLERTSDDRFDRRFIRMQVRGHEQAVDLFESFIEARQDQSDGAGNRGSQKNTQSQAGQTAQDQSAQAAAGQDSQGGPPLLQFAQQNLPALERHLRSARSIRENMRSGPDVAASQQSQPRQTRADGRSEESRRQDGDTARRFVVEQPRPRVTVTDPRSKVNIEQPQPRVTVRQQAPTVTIDQPPPEIVVHMPRPQVDVQDRQPRVSVNVPKPQVSVEQEGGSARVQVQNRSDEEAQVQYQRARPQVQFERAGEPRVVYRPTEQEPKIRYETEQQSPASARQQQAASRQGSPSRSSAQSSDARTGTQQATTAQQKGQGDQDWRDRTRQLAGSEDASSTTTGRAQRENADSTTTGRGDAAGSTTSMLVSRINDMPVYNARGQKLGEVEEVVADEATDKRFVILSSGGFLGLFEDEVAIPLDRFRASADRLVVSGLTDQDIDNMQDWEDRLPNSSALDDAQSVRIRR